MARAIAIHPNVKPPQWEVTELDPRRRFRELMIEQLRKVSGKPVKVMHYTAGLYLKKIVGEAQVELVGWPVDVPFGNLSHLKGRRVTMTVQLLRELESGRMHFRHLLPIEAKALQEGHITPGKCTPRPPRRTRADESQHHLRRVHIARYPRTGPKTPAIVEEAE